MPKYDLGKYTLVANKDEADLILQPAVLGTGVTPAPIYYRKNNKKPKIPKTTLDDINAGKAIWSPGVQIDNSNTLDPKDYVAIIAWWFGEMSKESNSYYPEMLAANYPGIDLREAIKKIRNSIEHYFTYTVMQTSSGPRYNKRLTRIDQKINQELRKYEKKGWYSKTK